MKRRQKKANPKKLHIKEVATKLFAKYGFEGISVTDIAKNAGVSVSMISYYFGGKTELYDAIIEDLFNKQSDFLSHVITLNEFHTLCYNKKASIFTQTICEIADLLYKNISVDTVMIVFREQQNQNMEIIQKSPGISYIRTLIADILEKDINSKEVVYCLLSILGLVSAPRLLSGFSIGLSTQNYLGNEDVELIRNGIKICVPLLLKSAKHYDNSNLRIVKLGEKL